jgi:hypothetical protein
MLGARAAMRRHTPALLDMPGVVGTAVTSTADGSAGDPAEVSVLTG